MHRVANYGSMLQATATKRILENLGFEVEFIDYWRPDQVEPSKWAAENSRFVRGRLTAQLQRYASQEYISKFDRVFPSYVESHLPLSRKYVSIEELREDPPTADVYVVGSDQVWNRDYNIGGTEPYVLDFGSNDIPRMSFASSIGKHPLTEEDQAFFRYHLRNFSWCSVRERTAQADLEDMGITAEVLPDPTLLLSGDDWRAFAGPNGTLRGYVLLYALNRGTGIRSRAKAVARKVGVPLITLTPRPLPWVRVARELRVPPVSTFVSLLAGASHVVTDSFHASAFSLNLGTPVSVQMPPKYQSRLTDLLESTGTSSRNFRHPDYQVEMPEELSVGSSEVLAASRSAALSRLCRVFAR